MPASSHRPVNPLFAGGMILLFLALGFLLSTSPTLTGNVGAGAISTTSPSGVYLQHTGLGLLDLSDQLDFSKRYTPQEATQLMKEATDRREPAIVFYCGPVVVGEAGRNYCFKVREDVKEYWIREYSNALTRVGESN